MTREIKDNMTGVITKLVEQKHFGFIRVKGESKDTFFHFDELSSDLQAEWGERLLERRVGFDQLDTHKGPAAVNIKPAI